MKSKPYILSVEDNPNDVALMSRIFKKKIADHDVFFFPDTGVTKNFLQEKHMTNALPNLILLDIKLIKGNGLDLLASLKNDDRFKHIPVVMLSSSGRSDDKNAAYLRGCNEYIEKPKSFKVLSTKLPEIIDSWSLKTDDS